MTEQGLRIPFFLLLEEDEYETRFGDGYFAYFAGAYRDRSVAEGHAEVQTKKSTAYHVKPATLCIEKNSITIEGEFDPNERFSPAQVVEFLLKRP